MLDFYNEAIQRKEVMKMAQGIFLGIISQFFIWPAVFVQFMATAT